MRTYKNLKKIKSEKEIIVMHHLGLGDAIVCNGMINFLSKQFDKIHLVVHKRYIEQISFLYKNNNKVKLFEIDTLPHANEIDSNLHEYSKINNLKVLKIGYEYRLNGPFNIMVYKQLKLDHNISFTDFYSPLDNLRSKKLLEHLKKYYLVEKEFILVHDQSDEIKYNINFNSKLKPIKIEKESDLFKNIFLYIPLIKEAKEIHCVDSSFIHLVERVDTDAKLYYHTNRGSNINLIKDWSRIDYES